jgi:hypothetical protein
MTRQRRNRILLWIIVLGLANFVSYTITYWHFIRERAGIDTEEVSRATWIYSFVHSISIWPTVGAVLVAMFILARPHIIATMKADAMIRGPTFITVCITVIVLITGASTFYFILSFINALVMIGRGQNWGV